MNQALHGKNILLGITGSIAAYKAADLIRELRHNRAHVQVVMTDHAKQFITPLTLQTLSEKPVYSDLFDSAFEQDIGHIQLARWADVILIAPASANIIARLAQGIADDLLTTLCLAATAPVIIAPAMNKYMWQHPSTIANLYTLEQRGVPCIEPASGEQACGDVGPGRMVESEELVTWLQQFFGQPLFVGKKVLITAGPTHEYIDPIRYIATASTGNMGYAIANVFAQLGAEVCLVSGPTTLTCPRRVTRVAVTSAEQMYQAVIKNLPVDIFIGAAAVGDYRVETPATNKLKRTADISSLTLAKNPDILLAVKRASPKTFMVGFAAETNDHLQHAQEKLHRKDVDMIVLNSVENNQGFGAAPSSVTVLTRAGDQIDWPPLPKSLIAHQLAQLIAEQLAI